MPKNWCLWTVVLEKTLGSPLDCKKIRPVILKEISPEYSLEGLMLKLKLQYFGHLMWRTNSLEKARDAGKASSGNWWWTGKPGMLQSMGSQRIRHNWETELIELISLVRSYNHFVIGLVFLLSFKSFSAVWIMVLYQTFFYKYFFPSLWFVFYFSRQCLSQRRSLLILTKCSLQNDFFCGSCLWCCI